MSKRQRFRRRNAKCPIQTRELPTQAPNTHPRLRTETEPAQCAGVGTESARSGTFRLAFARQSALAGAPATRSSPPSAPAAFTAPSVPALCLVISVMPMLLSGASFLTGADRTSSSVRPGAPCAPAPAAALSEDAQRRGRRTLLLAGNELVRRLLSAGRLGVRHGGECASRLVVRDASSESRSLSVVSATRHDVKAASDRARHVRW